VFGGLRRGRAVGEEAEIIFLCHNGKGLPRGKPFLINW
jgi:hypothetical protein